MRNLSLRNIGCFSLLCCLFVAWVCNAQEKVKTPKKPKTSAVKKKAPVKAKGKPLTSTLTVEKILATPATVDFTNSTLRDVVKWLEEEKKIAVYLHEKILETEGLSLKGPISIRLKNEPLSLILNSFQSYAWYVQEGILHMTTEDDALSRMVTKPYNVGDLLEDGFKQRTLLQAVYLIGDGWYGDNSLGGIGSSSSDSNEEVANTEWRGDILFVKQTYETHRLIADLLMAIRKHGRQTMISDPPIPQNIKEKLQKKISVSFDDIPLSAAIKKIAKQSQIKILFDDYVDDPTSVLVSLTLRNRNLTTVLQLLFLDLDVDLTWVIKGDVLLVTTNYFLKKTVVFDVSDLSKNSDESDELASSIKKMVAKSNWNEGYVLDYDDDDDDEERGSLVFLKPGTMIVRHNEKVLDEISRLLKMYRKALRESKRKMPDLKKKRNRVIARYYRVNTTMANELMKILPLLVQSDSWHLDKKIGSLGTISLLPTRPNAISVKKGKTEFTTVHVPYSVLIIFQTDRVHRGIIEVIQRIESGDSVFPVLRVSGCGGRVAYKSFYTSRYRGFYDGSSGGGFFSIRQ